MRPEHQPDHRPRPRIDAATPDAPSALAVALRPTPIADALLLAILALLLLLLPLPAGAP